MSTEISDTIATVTCTITGIALWALPVDPDGWRPQTADRMSGGPRPRATSAACAGAGSRGVETNPLQNLRLLKHGQHTTPLD